MRAYNFAGSSRDLTKFYRGMWLIAGVITFAKDASTKFGRAKTSKINRDF